MPRRALVIAFLVFALPAAARQVGPLCYPTIEYLVADGDLVVRGTVSKGPIVLTVPPLPEDQRGSDPNAARDVHYEKLSVRVAETLRRDVDALAADPMGQVIEFVVAQSEGASPAALWDGREMLLSLRTTARWTPDKGLAEKARWVVRRDWGSNFGPDTATTFWWAYDLAATDLPAYDVSAVRVKRGPDVLAAARRAAAFALPAVADEDAFYWTAGKARPFAEIEPVDRTDHSLLAPVDARLEAEARGWLGQAAESRWAWDNADLALDHFQAANSPETVAALQRLALSAPPNEDGWTGEGRWRAPAYGLRRWARRVLLRWKTPPGEWSRTFENRLPLRPVGAGSVALAAAPVVVYLVIWRYRRRRGRPFGLLSGALAALLVLSCAMWVRSYWRVDEVWAGPAAARHEVVSVDGRIQVLTLAHWDEPFGLMYGAAPRTGDLDRALAFDTLRPDAEASGSLLGVAWANGGTPEWPRHGKLFEYVKHENPAARSVGSGLFGGGGGGGGLFGGGRPSGIVYPFTFVSVAWWHLAGLGLLGPLSWAVTARRARRRRANGLCGHCGYDLRATQADRPCPECGSAHGARSTVAADARTPH